MSRVKQVSKRKRLTKAAGVPALGAAGLGLSLVGSASASALATADLPQSLNTTPNQRFVLDEEEIADVSLATFHVFDRENGTRGFTQVAWAAAAAAALDVAVAVAAVAAEGAVAAVRAATVTEVAAYRGAAAVIVESDAFLAHEQR